VQSRSYITKKYKYVIQFLSFIECDASTKHASLLDGIRKNSSNLRTMQYINTRLAPLCR